MSSCGQQKDIPDVRLQDLTLILGWEIEEVWHDSSPRSRNARPQKALVRRAHLGNHQAGLLRFI
ncbi:protein of unknown function [Nitrospira defluvii]|jgi:hypothetical protein|uniref:Uncharacterized protein n=1 Tax=Nitrospira defluvii TaxID=330214 RepID=D8PGV1_9BACT|nr:protein of unknown function [Nitrospira defluvii]